jgi:uncharacterized protein YjbI with pentapeptide repeats
VASAVGLDLPVPPNARPATDSGQATPIDEREAPSPGAEPAAPTAPEPKLPPIAEKADDLEEIKKAVDDAATVGGALWFSYLFVLFYLAVAAGAVTHADLFLEKPVKLPFLNIELPLLAFFFLAPILFLIVHAYTLVHLVMLTEKAKRFHQALYDPKRNVTAAARQNLQWQLPSNIFVQFLAGPRVLRERAFGSALRAIAWITLVIAPVLLLLMMQIQFLPYHNSFITWTHRIALLADLALIWWLWRKMLSGREIDRRHRQAAWTWLALGFALSLGIVLFSLMEATFPGEWQEDHLASLRVFETGDQSGHPAKVSLHDLVFNLPVDDTTRRRKSPFSGTLVLPGLNIYEALSIDDPKKADWRDYLFRARGRDLKWAMFDLATLRKVDFTGAQLEGASFRGAQLGGASFPGATLADALLIGTKLENAQLQGASLDRAQLQGASLDGAQLQGASLEYAELRGASLNGAHLQGASLAGAQLQGAMLASAQLQGASLAGAQLQGAQLQGALLAGAELQGARLDEAQLQVALSLPLDIIGSQKASGESGGNNVEYTKALAAAVRALVCSGGDNAINVLRGLLTGARVEAAGPEAPALVDFIMSKDCPVHASLTDADRAKLLRIKHDAPKKPGG